jgi:hypothetical protein
MRLQVQRLHVLKDFKRCAHHSCSPALSIVALLHDDAPTTLLGLLGLLLAPPDMLALDLVLTWTVDAWLAPFAECMGAMRCQCGILARHTILGTDTTVVGKAVAAIPAHCDW